MSTSIQPASADTLFSNTSGVSTTSSTTSAADQLTSALSSGSSGTSSLDDLSQQMAHLGDDGDALVPRLAQAFLDDGRPHRIVVDQQDMQGRIVHSGNFGCARREGKARY